MLSCGLEVGISDWLGSGFSGLGTGFSGQAELAKEHGRGGFVRLAAKANGLAVNADL